MRKILAACMLLVATAVWGEPYQIPAGMIETAAGMFPGAPAPHQLRYRSDISMDQLGFRLVNYDMYSAGNMVGQLSRLMSVENAELKSPVDILIRFEKGGEISRIETFYPTQKERNAEPEYFQHLLGFYLNKRPAEQQMLVQIVANGLAAAQEMRGTNAPAAPPEGFTLDLTNRILTSGAALNPVSVTSVRGTVFDMNGYTKPLALLFVSPECVECRKMTDAIRFAESKAGKGKMQVIYIVAADAKNASAYAKSAKFDSGFVVADAAGMLAGLFQIPFKPYALMYNKGVLQSNSAWEDEEKFLGLVVSLLGIE